MRSKGQDVVDERHKSMLKRGRRTTQKHAEAGNVARGGWNAGRFN